MKVLLLSPPSAPGFSRDARSDFMSLSDSHWHPIWLSYCGALLEKYQHKVRLIDAPSSHLSPRDTLHEIINFYPELLVVYSSTKTQEYDIGFCRVAKDRVKCKIVFVGPFTSLIPYAILKSSPIIDAVIKREFEFPILEIANGNSWEKIRNLVWKKNRTIIENELRSPLNREELDRLPFVTRFYKRHLNLKNYRIPSEPFPFVSLHSGRGCEWGRCSFCLWYPDFLKLGQYATRSIESVMEELKFVKQEMPEVKAAFFQDDTLSKKRINELSEAIMHNNLNITWSCYTRASLDYKTLKLMKSAGCWALHVGYESGDQSILDRAHKGLNVEIMTKFTEDAKKAGLRIYANFVVGLPGETEATIKKTVKWAKMLNPALAQFTLLNIYPNKNLYKYLMENEYVKNGRVSYPYLSSAQLCKCIKQAYREFYFSWRYIKKIFIHPNEYLFSQIRPISKMIPNILWRRW